MKGQERCFMYYIVIIDDDLSVQRELKLLLENAGYRADVAEDFANIPEYVQKLQPDLLLLDVALPGADGITLCSKIRMISDVPIIRSSRYLILSTSWRTHPRLEYMVFLQGI